MFQKRLEMETKNAVRRDMDMFDSKFASGDATATCRSSVSDTKHEAGSPSVYAVAEKSGVNKCLETGGSFTTPQAGDLSDSSVATSRSTLSSKFTVPSGSFQFQADWKTLKKHPEEFYMYFKVNIISLCCM